MNKTIVSKGDAINSIEVQTRLTTIKRQGRHRGYIRTRKEGLSSGFRSVMKSMYIGNPSLNLIP